jgi:predicted Zn-dependent protease
VKNTEELAGTLCHEVSHTIHRDGVALMEKNERIKRHEVEAAILLGPTRAHLIAILLVGKLHSLGYSREAESAADVTGADICAAAGYNPWGLVDHPANGTRVQTLEKHFKENASTFSKFSADPKSATPFSVPKDAPERFLPPPAKDKR